MHYLTWYDIYVPSHPFTNIDHVQLAMPPGEEETARRFYHDLLGMVEIPKPAGLAGCHISDPFGNRIELISS
jgi:4-hydroxyphenylpyruvate dioxygenase-like putative hemolysin